MALDYGDTILDGNADKDLERLICDNSKADLGKSDRFVPNPSATS